MPSSSMSVANTCSGQFFPAAASSSISSIAREYASSPDAQPGTQTRNGSSVGFASTSGPMAFSRSSSNASASRKNAVTLISRSLSSCLTSSASWGSRLLYSATSDMMPQSHPAFDAPENGALLVASKITARLGQHEGKDVLNASGFCRGLKDRRPSPAVDIGMPKIFQDAASGIRSGGRT